jgi:hypothetical protein
MAPAWRAWCFGFLGAAARWYAHFDRCLLLREPLLWRSRMIPALLLAPLGWPMAFVMAQTIPTNSNFVWHQGTLQAAEFGFLLFVLLVCALWGLLQLRYPLGERGAKTHLMVAVYNVIALVALLSANSAFQGSAHSRIASAMSASELRGYLDSYRRLGLEALIDAQGRNIDGRSYDAERRFREKNCSILFSFPLSIIEDKSLDELLVSFVAACDHDNPKRSSAETEHIESLLHRGDALLTIQLYQASNASFAARAWNQFVDQIDVLLMQAVAGAALLFAVGLPTSQRRRWLDLHEDFHGRLPVRGAPRFVSRWQRELLIRWPTMGSLAPLTLLFQIGALFVGATVLTWSGVFVDSEDVIVSCFFVAVMLYLTVFWWLRLTMFRPRADRFMLQFKFSLCVCACLSPFALLMLEVFFFDDVVIALFMIFFTLQVTMTSLASLLSRLENSVAWFVGFATAIYTIFMVTSTWWDPLVWLVFPAALSLARLWGRRSPLLRWMAILAVATVPVVFSRAILAFYFDVFFSRFGSGNENVDMFSIILFLIMNFLLVMPALRTLADDRYWPQPR